MATPVIMPRLGQSVEDCILAEWKVAPGAVVEEGTAVSYTHLTLPTIYSV